MFERALRLQGTVCSERVIRRCLTALASVTGGTRLGIMIALANCLAVWGTTLRSVAPSRTWRCQSSGRVIVSVWTGADVAAGADATADALGLGRPAAGAQSFEISV